MPWCYDDHKCAVNEESSQQLVPGRGVGVGGVSPSTSGWEEAGLCEFQASLVHIKSQANYPEGTGRQADYG